MTGRNGRDQAGEQQRCQPESEAQPLREQVTSCCAQRGGDQAGQPVEGLASTDGDTKDPLRFLNRVLDADRPPPAERHGRPTGRAPTELTLGPPSLLSDSNGSCLLLSAYECR